MNSNGIRKLFGLVVVLQTIIVLFLVYGYQVKYESSDWSGLDVVKDEFKGQIPVLCPSETTFQRIFSFDPGNKYVVQEAVDSPLKYCAISIKHNDILVPGRVWSRTLGTYKYGGFTADMGWILTVARYALLNNQSVMFPKYWGHGRSSWTSFFDPISTCTESNAKQKITQMVQETTEHRHAAKISSIYHTPALSKVRNSRLAEFIPDLNPMDDLKTMRNIFSWVFRPNSEVRARIDLLKKRMILGRYIGVHLRGGDKVGHNKGGPVEADYVPMNVYVDSLLCTLTYLGLSPNDFDAIFVSTDEFEELKKFKRALTSVGVNLPVVTSASETDTGFSIKSYREEKATEDKFLKSIELYADMELLAEADIFVGNLQSNVGKTVHLMRYQHPNTTVSCPTSNSPRKSCCVKNTPDALMANCFWLCSL